jgi:hypothetical protein
MVTNIEPELLLVIERRKFEKWARDHVQYCNLDRASDGQYARKSMNDCWNSWKAALAIN